MVNFCITDKKYIHDDMSLDYEPKKLFVLIVEMSFIWKVIKIQKAVIVKIAVKKYTTSVRENHMSQLKVKLLNVLIVIRNLKQILSAKLIDVLIVIKYIDVNKKPIQ